MEEEQGSDSLRRLTETWFWVRRKYVNMRLQRLNE